MPKVGCAITKEGEHRGVQEEFDNVYAFTSDTEWNEQTAQELVGEVVAAEKEVYAANIDFVRGRVWTIGATPADSETLLITDLSGPGLLPQTTSGMNLECCYLVEWKTDRPSSTEKPVRLKKYLRSGFTISPDDGDTIRNIDRVNTGDVATKLITYANAVRDISTASITAKLCAPSSNRIAQDPLVFPWLEYHKLKY